MPVAPDLGFLGVAKETSKGVAVAATAFPPIRVARNWQDVLAQLDDDGMRGSMIDGPYDQIAGTLFATYEVPQSPVFADTFPWFLFGILGDVTTVASRSVADAVTNSTTTVTSATAAFTQKDIGALITASADFAAGTFIVSITSGTSIIISQAALTAGASKTLAFAPATVNNHSGSVKNSTDGQPTSMTLTDFYGVTGGTPARQMAGAQVEELSLKFSGDGFFEYAAKLKAFGTTLVAKPTLTVGTVTPEPGWELVPYVGGTVSAVLVSGEMSFKRPTSVIHTADGTQAPYRIFQGGLNVSGKATMVAEDDSEYLRYLNSTKPTILLRIGHGSGATAVSVAILMTKCNVKNGKANHGGDYMAWDMEWQALWNATDAGASGGLSACRVNVMNAVAASTYQ